MNKIRFFINSPWVLLAVPLLVGGFWLVLNPWIITNNLNKPYALLAGPSLVGSVLVGWLVLRFFSAIERGCKLAVAAFMRARQEDGSAQFFWIVIIVFLAVSVFASGSFFSILERDALPGLGYATALFIDLVAVQCMRARLNAVRLRDGGGALLYLLGVLICAGASAFANVYTSLAAFAAPAVGSPAAGGLPAWMIALAPWFGLVFPVLIVLLSMTADYTIDQSSGHLEPEKYRAQEEKRVKILEIQRDMLRTRVTVEREIDQLTASLKHRDSGRVFFLVAWLFPEQKQNIQPVVDASVASATKPLEDTIAELKAENERLGQRVNQTLPVLVTQLQALQSVKSVDLTGLTSSIEALAGQVRALQAVEPVNIGALTGSIVSQLEEQYAEKFEAVTEQVRALRDEMGQEGAFDLVAEMQDLIVDYPGLVRWIESGQRSATEIEIAEITGHSSRMVASRVKDHTFHKTNRPGAYRLSSVILWLKGAPLPKSNKDTTTALEAVKSSSNGHSKAVVNAGQLVTV